MEDRSYGGPAVLQWSCIGPLINNIAGPDRRIGEGVLLEKIMEDRSCGGPVVLQRSCSGPLIDNIAGPDRRIREGVL